MKFPIRHAGRENGFSLIELMVAIAIVAVIIVALATVFERSGRIYTTQNVSAALQEEVRAAVEVMAREVRMACYNPNKKKAITLKNTTSTHFRFYADLNENGKPDYTGFPNCERLSFRYSNSAKALQMICNEGAAGQDIQTLIGNTDTRVTAVDFSYRNVSGTATTSIHDARAVVISVTAEAPAGRAGMIERTYTTWVDFRNVGANDSIL